MGVLANIFSSSASDIIREAGDAIDKVVTSDEEKLALKNELAKIRLEATDKLDAREKELDATIEQEVTKRQQSDMASDNKLSKNIRPGAYAYTICAFTILAVSDGNLHWNELEFTVNPEYILTFKALLLVMTGFYFGSRGLEKVVQIVSKAFGKAK